MKAEFEKGKKRITYQRLLRLRRFVRFGHKSLHFNNYYYYREEIKKSNYHMNYKLRMSWDASFGEHIGT